MKLSERIYKFIDDVGGVGPNNETRVRSLCKEVAQLEADLAKTNRAMQAAIDAGVIALAEIATLKRENEIAKYIGGRIKWFADWHKSKGRSEIKNMPLGMLDEWANTLLTAEESE